MGPRGILAEVSDPAAALSLAAWARGRVTAEEIVPGACTVGFDGVRDVAALASTLEGWLPNEPGPPGPLVEIQVAYDGPDLAAVADAWQVDVATVIARHQEIEFTSAFCGFAPGFAYLSGLPPEWQVGRLAEPRSRVPAGSVALADTWCAVYPNGSPGGWQLIGSTDHALWDLDQDPPAVLTPGTRVRFVAR